ncbi:MAG: transglycosylase SLT domain-containing protein [Deltaproteobacteria bacterium]|jgi:hypothetical protein|nr:transglycosylase SLT domain-containing protein [Deltaproteobacteria bacterium]
MTATTLRRTFRPARLWLAALGLAALGLASALAPLTVPALALAQALNLGSLDFCGEPVPLGRVEVHESVDQELLLLSEAKSRVWLTLRRSERHLPVIGQALKAAGVPADFQFLPMAAANLDPLHASGQRRGLWRLTPAEALAAGLRVDKEIDERLDPTASSAAAAARLAALKIKHGSWTLAAAAFIDEGALTAAQTEAGGEKDFFKLFVPETLEKSVSLILAGKVLYSNPAAYGYRAQHFWPVLAAKRRQLAAPASLRTTAQELGLDYRTFRDLNPHVLTDQAPAGAWLNVP